MSEHTPTPWNCASRYSSVVGVPIINQQGRRVGNTALPDMPPEWDHMKRQGEIDAAFICLAVNNHAALMKALTDVRQELWVDYCLRVGRTDTDPKPFESKPHIRIIDGVLSAVGASGKP